MTTPSTVTLREATLADLPTFFQFQLDPEANRMAAFTSKDPTDRAAYDAHWARNMANPDNTMRTILYNGEVAGSIFKYLFEGNPDIGYWIGKEYWGKGIATEALTQFLTIITERPLYAAAAADNIGSISVLQKCGFVRTGTTRGFSAARNEEIEEALFKLD